MPPMRLFTRKTCDEDAEKRDIDRDLKTARKNAAQNKAKRLQNHSAVKNVVQVIPNAAMANIPMYSKPLSSQSLAYSKTSHPQAAPEILESEIGIKWPNPTVEAEIESSTSQDPQSKGPEAEQPADNGYDSIDDDNRAVLPEKPSILPAKSWKKTVRFADEEPSKVRKIQSRNRPLQWDSRQLEQLQEDWDSINLANPSGSSDNRRAETEEPVPTIDNFADRLFAHVPEPFPNWSDLPSPPASCARVQIEEHFNFENLANASGSSDHGLPETEEHSDFDSFANAPDPRDHGVAEIQESFNFDNLANVTDPSNYGVAEIEEPFDFDSVPNAPDSSYRGVAEIQGPFSFDSVPNFSQRNYGRAEIEEPFLDFDCLANSPGSSDHGADEIERPINFDELTIIHGSRNCAATEIEDPFSNFGNLANSPGSSVYGADEVEEPVQIQTLEPAVTSSYADAYLAIVDDERARRWDVPEELHDDAMSSSTDYSEFWQPWQPNQYSRQLDERSRGSDVLEILTNESRPSEANYSSHMRSAEQGHSGFLPREDDEPDLPPAQLNTYRILNNDVRARRPWLAEGLPKEGFFQVNRKRFVEMFGDDEELMRAFDRCFENQ